jgi:GT2 family glycosyltransferase
VSKHAAPVTLAVDDPPRSADSRRVRGFLSVVVVSHNGLRLLEACLQSLASDSDRDRYEVTVVDNASTDGAVEMVRRSHPWVRLIESGSNLGFARAANIGIRDSIGEYLLLLNPDTVVPAGTLGRCVDALAQQADVGMLGCKLVRPDGTLDHACKRSFPTPSSALAHMSKLSRLMGGSRPGAYTAAHVDEDAAALVDAVNGAFMLVRREALDSVGLLDERYWMYGEDLDWCFRFWAAGWPVLYWPEATVLHVNSGIAGRHRAWRTNLSFHRAMWIFFSCHQAQDYSPLVRWAVWTAIWLKLAVSAMRSATVRSVHRLHARS